MLEVLPRGVNKGVGVARMLDHLGVAPSEARARDSTRLAVGALRLDAVCAPQVLAIGDAENDLEMLRLVGTSVAMGNASPEVQARAPRRPRCWRLPVGTRAPPHARHAAKRPKAPLAGAQRVADFVTDSNSEDGAAKALERFVLGQS